MNVEFPCPVVLREFTLECMNDGNGGKQQRHQFEPTLNVNLELKIKDCSDMCSNNRPKGCFPVTRFHTHVHARKRLNPFLYQITKLQMNSCFDVENSAFPTS